MSNLTLSKFVNSICIWPGLLPAVVALLVVPVACGGGATGAPPAEEPTSPTPYAAPQHPLGAALETHFKQLHESCDLLAAPSRTTSYVPKAMAAIGGPIDPALSVATLDSISATRVFYQILSSQGFDAAKIPDPALALNPPSQELPLPERLQDAVLYRQDCSRTVQAAIEAELSPPYASIKSALSGQGSTSAELAVAGGRFYSPLFLQLNSMDEDRAASARFALWNHYQMHRERLPNPSYYLLGFDGVVVYRGRTSKQQFEVRLAAEAGGTFGFARANGSLELQGARSTSMQIDDYAVYIRKDGDAQSATFDVLPSEDALRAYFTDKAYALSSGDSFLLPNATKTLDFRVRGMPPEMCNRDRWNVELANGEQGTVSFFKNPDPSDGCRFFVDYVPDSNVFSQNVLASPLVIVVKIVTGSGDGQLALAAQATLNRIDDLGVNNLGAYDKAPQFRDANSAVEWHLGGLELDDATDRIIPNSARPAQKLTSTTCNSILTRGSDTDVLFVTGPRGSDARLDIRARLKDADAGKTYSLSATRSCNLVIELKIPLKQQDAKREITIPVSEPTTLQKAETGATDTVRPSPMLSAG